MRNVQNIREAIGLEDTDRNYVIVANEVEIKGVKMDRGEILGILFNLVEEKIDPRKNTKKPYFKQNVNQFLVEQYTERGELVGGQLIKIKTSH